MFLALLILIIVALLAGAVLGILALLVIGIRRGDRVHLANAPRSYTDEIARRIVVGLRYPAENEEDGQ